MQLIIISCISPENKPNKNQEIKFNNKVDKVKTPFKSESDSLNDSNIPSYQQMYTETEKIYGILGKLKFSPSTEKKTHNYLENNDSISITMYYLKTRIITVEKRIYRDKTEDEFLIYDFDENNNAITENRWKNSEKITYSNAILWDKLIRFNSKYEVFDLDEKQKQEIIRSTKASLDSIMQFFPEFKYTFNWETYLTKH